MKDRMREFDRKIKKKYGDSMNVPPDEGDNRATDEDEVYSEPYWYEEDQQPDTKKSM